MNNKEAAPFIGVERLRIPIDGDGVTTLAAFRDCTLRCQYCLNPQSLDSNTLVKHYTAQELIDYVKIDSLYFVATGGGVTFGGGEPLLRSSFIKRFRELCPKEWMINIETALNVPLHHLQEVVPFTHQFIIDIKDMNADIYEKYTTKDNKQVIENLKWLCRENMQDKCKIRLPLIADFNTEADRKNSKKMLEEMGYNDFNPFSYIKNVNDYKKTLGPKDEG